MSGPLDRQRILDLFDELSDELRFTRTRAQIYIIGGAAMSLAFARDRTTRDIDARIDTGHSRLTEAVQKIGRKYGLGDTWLNDQATTAIPRTTDIRARTLYDSPWRSARYADASASVSTALSATPGVRGEPPAPFSPGRERTAAAAAGRRESRRRPAPGTA